MHSPHRPSLRAILILFPFFAIALAAPVSAADPDFAELLPRIAPKEPADAIGTFKLIPGCRIELAASEPILSSPVAMCFDEDGKLFIVEMRDYPEAQPKDGGCVRLLIDTNDDGVFDKSTVYVDKLAWPTAVFCWDGGIFVGAAPDILYCKDTDGDGVADIRKTIYTGFGTQNVQGLLNSFRWGLDNRIHGAASSNGGEIRRVATEWGGGASAVGGRPSAVKGNASPADGLRPAADVPLVNVRGRDFSFDPRTLDFRAESGGGQHGMCFDDFGRKFVCSNSDHLQLVMYGLADVERNPYVAAPGPRVSIAEDGPQAEVYRISPVEPWRTLRTKLRVEGKVPGPIEGGGRAAGYFTGSTGVTIYRGDAMKDLQGMAFVGDVGSNIVHRKGLYPRGLELYGKRWDEKSEFLASTDIWFRPVQFGEAPDGCLYILDMYREVIEHPASLPPAIKKHLDLTSGQARGRLWRVRPQDDIRRRAPKTSTVDTETLVTLLSHDNAWHRETAARLIFQRQDKEPVPLLRKLVSESTDPKPGIHALYALAGLNALDDGTIVTALTERGSVAIMTHALRLSADRARESAVVRVRVDGLAFLKSQPVRYQVAWALGRRSDAEKVAPLAHILALDYEDRWMRLAVLSSSRDCSGELLARVAGHKALVQSKEGREVLVALAQITGRESRPAQVAAVVRSMEKLAELDRETHWAITRALADGLTRAAAEPRKQSSTVQPVPTTPAPVSNTPRREIEFDAFKPALKLSGDIAKGEKLFAERCATCHKLDGQGFEVGPNLAAMAARGPEAILLNVIDPSREVNPQYLNHIVKTKEGDTHTGLILSETGTTLELLGPKGEKRTLLRIDLESIRSTGLSLMPEELEKGLDSQAMADLIAYLMKAR